MSTLSAETDDYRDERWQREGTRQVETTTPARGVYVLAARHAALE